MSKYYKLDKNKIAIPTDLMTWARGIENFDYRRVGIDIIGEYKIYTVFLGLDYSYNEELHLFETMVFKDKGKGDEEDMERCGTWIQAEEMHKRFVDKYAKI